MDERIDTIKAQVDGIPLIRPCEPPDETCCTSVGTVRSTALRAAGGTHRPAGEHRAGGAWSHRIHACGGRAAPWARGRAGVVRYGRWRGGAVPS